MAQPISDQQLKDLIPPNNIEAEMAALGSMMLSERASEEIINFITEDDFYVPAHREIFKALTTLLMSHKAIDLVTLKNELLERETLDRVGGIEYLIKIVESVPSAANSTYYAGIVQDKATLRRLEDAANQILKDVHKPDGTADEMVNDAESLVFEVGRKRLGKYFEGVADLATQFFEDVDHLMDTGEPILGMPTGYSDLDAVTTGFYGGDFVIIAARPAMGKTSLALNFALHVAGQATGNVAIFSLEMSGQQLVRRLISMLAKVPMNTLKKANLSNENYQRLVDACEDLHNMPIFIDDSSDISPLEMRGKCRRLKADGGLALVIVDYLQLMRGSRRSENRTQEIGEIARGLKAMSKELDVPVIALSQLNRAVESRENKRPMLADIRESGSIEAEADMVMFIYRHKYYQRQDADYMQESSAGENEATELIIGKHRNGPTGTVLLGFQPSFTRFTQLDADSKAQYWKMLRDRSE